MALVVGFGYLIGSGAAWAAETGPVPGLVGYFPVSHIVTFLFLMLGPFKIIGPFVKLTKGAGPALERKIALIAIAFSCAALLVAGLLGEILLEKYGVPLPILGLAGGIILFLVALQETIRQFTAEPEPADKAAAAVSPTTSVALKPLAFPTIVTPYGIAALVVFLAFSPDTQSRLTIGAIVLAIMVLNFLTMIFARRIPPVAGVGLAILGAVLGVVQVALGLQIISNSLRALGVG